MVLTAGQQNLLRCSAPVRCYAILASLSGLINYRDQHPCLCKWFPVSALARPYFPCLLPLAIAFISSLKTSPLTAGTSSIEATKLLAFSRT
jgi:hypothetical protein